MKYINSFLCLTIILVNILLGQNQNEDKRELYKSELQRYQSMLKASQNSASDNNIDVKYYKLNLTITTSPNYIRGIVTMKAVSVVNSLSTVTLDLKNALTVDSIKMNNIKVTFAQSISTVLVNLNGSYNQDELFEMDIYYRGVPSSSGFGSFTFSSQSGIPWIYSLSEPYGARDWWPCKDHPLDKADSVDIWITCRDDLKVGSNGKLVEVVNNGNGTKTHKWESRYPITTYLISISITNYAQFSNWFKYTETDSMEVLNYVLPSSLSTALNSLPKTIDMLHIFSNLYGLYPFINEKYGHAQFGWGGGMEHQTMTSLGGFSEDLVSHELAHMWFGDMITCANWPNIWINEGFATYSEALYREFKYGTSSYWSIINSDMTSAKNAVGTIYVQDTTNVSTLFNGNLVYAKGSTVLHMLRHVVGDSIFFEVIKTYANDPRFKFKVATTEDFKGVCETVSGKQLDYYFNQWIYGEKYPRYTYSWISKPAVSGFDVTVTISQTTQTTNPSFFTMPVDFKLSATGWDTTVVLFNNVNNQVFLFNVSRQPTSGALDPNNWILKTATQVPARVDGLDITPYAFKLEQNYPNPFNPTTTIKYTLPEHGNVLLKIFSPLGKEVSTLVSEWQSDGDYEITWDASEVSGGVYFYTLTIGNHTASKKLILIK